MEITLPGSSALIRFVAASLVVLVIPGPGVLYIVARSISQGRVFGFVSVLGLSAGAFVQVAVAAVGLSAVLLSSAAAFEFVRMLGVGYLIFIGIRTLRARPNAERTEAVDHGSLPQAFTEGIVVSVLNPKIAVFFLAFLPQFVDRGRGSVSLQVLGLGLIYVLLALLTDGTYAYLAGSLRNWISGRVMQGPLPRYASGVVFIGLGAAMALGGRGS